MATIRKMAHGRDIWAQFRDDEELRAKHEVTDEEIQFLETVALFGSLESVEDILVILRNIRPK